jgi:menaquinone-9 beta-reductase
LVYQVTHLRIPAKVDADVVVVGGGPAGASAAARLAAGGARVIVMDQRSFPRDKVCGDFVGPAAIVELEALGITTRPDYAASNIIRGAALFLDGRELIRRRLPEVENLPSYGRCIPRMQLDQWLLDAARDAGAQIMLGARVHGFDVANDAIVVHAESSGEPLRLRARLLIGADGSGSIVARELRGEGPADENRIIAVRAYYEGVTGPEDRCDLYFSAESFPGYYWLFPTGAGEANVGVGMVLETLPPTTDHLRDLLLALVARDSALSARLAGARLRGKVVGWPLTTYDARLPVVGERVLLTGDAAGFINPLNGEGIQYALISGRWAAESALESLTNDDFTEARLAGYADRAARELRYDMALASLIVQFIRNRHLNQVWLEALKIISARARIDDEYARITGGILAGLTPARQALSVKVLGCTLDQALYSTLLGTAWTALEGPTNLARKGVGIAHATASVASILLTNPIALADWIVGLVRQSGELAIQFGGHLGERLPVPEQPRPLFSSRERVRIPSSS